MGNTANTAVPAARRKQLLIAGVGANIALLAYFKVGDHLPLGISFFTLMQVMSYLTATHGRKSEQMHPREYWGAFGSISLLNSYADYWRNQAHHHKDVGDENGTEPSTLVGERVDKFAALSDSEVRAEAAAQPIVVDEAAFAEYAHLVRSARANGARVVAFIPPIYAPVYDGERGAYLRDRATFPDVTHLSPTVAAYFSTELASAIAQGSEP